MKSLSKKSLSKKSLSKKAFIIHGWDGNIKQGWFVWLKSELEKKGYTVIAPRMPDPPNPIVDVWVKKLSSIAKNVNKNTLFIGHSVGCKTIMRYLEKSDVNCDKCIFVAPWLDLKESTYAEYPDMEEELRKIAKPWINTKINFKKIKGKAKFISIFSTNDPYVALDNAKIMRKELNSKIIIQKNKKHYADGYTKKILVILKLL